jgi:hypothetical protein
VDGRVKPSHDDQSWSTTIVTRRCAKIAAAAFARRYTSPRVLVDDMINNAPGKFGGSR